MKKEIKKVPVVEDRWINVHDDSIMLENGLIRYRKAEFRDPSVWSKTKAERNTLNKAKAYTRKLDMHFGTYPRKLIPVKSKLIVYLVKNKVFPNTVYSRECFMHEIPDIISKYCDYNKKSGNCKNLVLKYFWNGKTYSPREVPFWR